MSVRWGAAQRRRFKHATQQVVGRLSNGEVHLWRLGSARVEPVVGARTQLRVVTDWAELDADDQATLHRYSLMRDGRTPPLAGHTVGVWTLGGKRNRCEDEVLESAGLAAEPARGERVGVDAGLRRSPP